MDSSERSRDAGGTATEEAPPEERTGEGARTSGPPADARGDGAPPESPDGGEGDGIEDAPEPFQMQEVGKHAVIYGAGILLSKAVGFVMLPIYTRYLTPADYGVMSLIEMTLDVIAIMAGARLAAGVFRYYHKADEDDTRATIVSTALLTMGASYFTLGMGTFALAEPLSNLVFDSTANASLIRIAAGAFVFQSLLVVPLAFVRVQDRSKFYVGANATKLVIGLGLNILFLVVLGWGVEGVFTSTLITNAVVGLTLSAWTLRQTGVTVTKRALKALMRYGIPLMGMQFATFTVAFSDRYFLQAYGGESVVGLYSLAYKFGFLLAVVGYSPFAKVWGPKRFEIAQRPDSDELLASGFVYVNVFLVTVAVGIALFVEDLLRVMSDPSFHAAADVVPLILAAYVLQSWAQAQDIGILVREKTEYVTAANWIAAIVAVAGFWFLVPRYLEWGAAIATLAAFIVRYALTLFFSQKLWYVEYRWSPVIRLVVLAVAATGTGLLVPEMAIWKSVGVRALLLGAYLAAVWNLDVLTDDERGRLLQLGRKAWLTIRGMAARHVPVW